MLRKFYLRLDDFSDYCNIHNWKRLFLLISKYDIIPLVGVIPKNDDSTLFYSNVALRDIINLLIEHKCIVALHGFNHVYSGQVKSFYSKNVKSEFAGLDYDVQLSKIVGGLKELKDLGIKTDIFFAPSHSYDENTFKALKSAGIKYVCDGIGFSNYSRRGLEFIPQQFGEVRDIWLGGSYVFCLHPNTMLDSDFLVLEKFLSKRKNAFEPFHNLLYVSGRNKNIFERLFTVIYFTILHSRRCLKKYFSN